MPRPPHPPNRYILISILVTSIVSVSPVAAQPSSGIETGFSPIGDAIGSLLITLLVGGALVYVVPDFTERTTDRILENPLETFVYGLVITIIGVILAVLLAITIIGLLFVIPMIFAAIVIGILGYLAAGRTISEEWTTVLLIAALISAVTGGIPVLGAIIGIILSSMGIGAVFLEYKDGGGSTARTGRSDTNTGFGQAGRKSSSGGVVPSPGQPTDTEQTPREDRHGEEDGDAADEWSYGIDEDPDQPGENR